MSVKKNLIYNVAYQILIMIMPLITAPYVSRTVGDEQLGTFSYTYSIASYFALFAILGLNNYGNRAIARIRDDKEELSKNFWEIFAMQFILGVIVSVLYVLWTVFLYNGNKVLALIQLGYVFADSFNINWFFFGLEKFKLTVTRNTILKIASAIAIFVFVKGSEDILVYAMIMMLAVLIGQIVLWIYLKNEIHWVRPKPSGIIKHVKPNLVLFVPVIAVSVYKVMDKIMLGSMSEMAQVAYYEYGEKINVIAVSVITALGTVMLPQISHLLAKGDFEKSKQYLQKSMTVSMLLSSAMAFGIAAVGKSFAVWFYGQEFAMSGNVMVGLSITIVFIACANVIRTQYLIPKGFDGIYIKSVILGAVINFVINFMFIPKYQAMGAVIGTVAAEFIVMFYQMFSVRKALPVWKYLKEALIFGTMGLIMYLVIRGMNMLISLDGFGQIVLDICVGALVYLLIAGVYLYRYNKEIYESILLFIPFLKRRSICEK